MRSRSLLAVALLLVAAFVPAAAAQPTSVPDIEVTEVGWDQLQLGEPTNFTATIANSGDDDREEPFDVWLRLEDGDFNETVTIDQLNESESAEISTPVPWNPSIGSHTVNVTADVDESGTLQENRNANNHRERSFEIGPDVTVHQVRVDPTTPVQDQEVGFEARIENVAKRGEYDVNDPFVVEFDIGDDDTTVPSLTTDPIDPPLRAHDPIWVSSTGTWSATEGSYTVTARADPAENVTEADPDNNTADRAFDVKPALPDLVVTDVGPADPRPAPGEDVAVEATIENQGTADVDEEFPVRFRINGTTYGSDVTAEIDEDGMQPGENVTVESEDWPAVEGHHELLAIADPGNGVVQESKTANNERTRMLHVGPDLVVPDVLWTPETPAADSEVAIEPRVANQGTVDISDNTTVRVTIPGEEEWTAEIGPLAAGGSSQVHIGTWQNPDNATYTLEAEADVDDDAAEFDETNNGREETMIVTEARPDIATTDISLDPASPASGEETTIEATIENLGSAAADQVDVEFRVDGESLGERTIAESPVDEFAAGASTTVSSDAWTPQTGEHRITVRADTDPTEIREDNNDRERSAAIGPDALIEDIDPSPADADVGEEVTFDVVAANDGTEAIDRLPVRILLNGEPIDHANASDLSAGSNQTVTATWTSEEGDHTVRAVADPDDEVTEARETNNERTESFSTTASPDVQATSIRWSEDPEAGDKLRFTAQLANTGTAPVEGSFTTAFHVGDEEIGAATTDGLETDSSTSVTSEAWTAQAGTHTIRVVVDADDEVTEDDGETNNERTATVTVADASDRDDGEDPGPANLVVAGISPPEDIEPGDQVTFLATIENEGGQRAGASEARILVDGELLGQPSVDALAGGQRISVTSDSWNATDGEHTVRVVADVTDDVDESDEEDNERVKRIRVGNASQDPGGDEPDIGLGPVSTTQPAQAGETTRPTVEVTNRGDGSTDATVTFYVDGTQLGEASLAGLDPDETVTLEGPDWEPTPGQHTLTARSGDAQAQTIVDAGEGTTEDAPGPSLGLLLAALALSGALARRRRRS